MPSAVAGTTMELLVVNQAGTAYLAVCTTPSARPQPQRRHMSPRHQSYRKMRSSWSIPRLDRLVPASLNLAQRVAQTLRSGVWGRPRARLGLIQRVMTPFKECLISSPELCFDVIFRKAFVNLLWIGRFWCSLGCWGHDVWIQEQMALEPSLHRSFYRQRVKASGAALVDNTVEEPASSKTWTGGSEGGRSRQVERERERETGKTGSNRSVIDPASRNAYFVEVVCTKSMVCHRPWSMIFTYFPCTSGECPSVPRSFLNEEGCDSWHQQRVRRFEGL